MRWITEDLLLSNRIRLQRAAHSICSHTGSDYLQHRDGDQSIIFNSEFDLINAMNIQEDVQISAVFNITFEKLCFRLQQNSNSYSYKSLVIGNLTFAVIIVARLFF